MKRTPLSRRTPLRKVNPERKKRRKDAGEVYGPYFGYVSKLPCMLIGNFHHCRGLNTAHHLKSVGAGGHDEQNLVPICQGGHAELHMIGRERFQARHLVALSDEASRTWSKWERTKRYAAGL